MNIQFIVQTRLILRVKRSIIITLDLKPLPVPGGPDKCRDHRQIVFCLGGYTPFSETETFESYYLIGDRVGRKSINVNRISKERFSLELIL